MGAWKLAGVIGSAGEAAGAPKDNPPKALLAAGAAGVLERPTLPKIETRSSSGLLDVPANRFAAAGVEARAAVAAMPDGSCSSVVGSSKLRRFSAC